MAVYASIGGGASLRSDAAASFARMRVAGMPATTMTSAYRSIDEQRALFFANYSTSKVGARQPLDRRIYNGVAYYRRAGGVAVGVPGTSKHNEGTAIDISGGMRTWVATHGKTYGWARNPQLPDEPWHFEYTPTNDTSTTEDDMVFTEAQLTQIAANGTATALMGAQSQTAIRDIVWNKTTVSRGGKRVSALQELADAKTQASAANAKADAILAALSTLGIGGGTVDIVALTAAIDKALADNFAAIPDAVVTEQADRLSDN